MLLEYQQFALLLTSTYQVFQTGLKKHYLLS
jgi:hypothetical protein